MLMMVLRTSWENLTCTIYGDPRLSRFDVVIYLMLKKMVSDSEKITKSSKVDLSITATLQQISPPTQGKIPYCSVEEGQGGFCRYAKSYSA